MGKMEDDLADSIAQIIDEETRDAKMHLKKSEDEYEDVDFLEEDDEYEYEYKKSSGNKKMLVPVICITMVLVVFITVFLALVMLMKNRTQSTFAYNYDKGKTAFNNKSYDEAIEYFEESLRLAGNGDKTNIVDVNMYLYDCYAAKKQPNNQINALNRVLSVDKYNAEAVKALAKCYYSTGNGAEINNMIAAYKNSQVFNSLSDYILPLPTVNYQSGTYEENIVVEITSATPDSKIYYTLDGSVPTAFATEYTTPFEVGSGEVELKIMAVSNIGINSEVAVYEYEVKYGTPSKPALSITSGTYKELKIIEITNIPVDATAYYTWDGTKPTTSSAKYDPEKKIEMIPGNNILSVIIISKYNLESSVTKNVYNVTVASKYTSSQAMEELMKKLIENKTLETATKLATKEECRFVFYTTVKVDDKFIYLINFDILKSDKYERQGYYYGVDGNTLELYKVTLEGQKYNLSPIK